MSGQEFITVACPHCLAGNRMLAVKAEDSPQCGKCHLPLFTGVAIEANEVEWHKHLQLTSLPIVVDFWAPWCGPCKAMAPSFNESANRLEPHFRFLKINTESEQNLAQHYQIQSIPTLMLIQDGKIIGRQSGAMNTGQLMQWLSSLSSG